MTNAELMKAMGSKTGQYDPEPPDQWRWDLHNGSPEDKLVAWVKSKTVGLGHSSPYAVDDHKKALYIQNVAADLGWNLNTARNVCYAVHAEGRIRLDQKTKRIFLAAEFPMDPKRRTNGESIHFVQSEFPPYVTDFIENMPKEKRQWAIEKYAPFWTWQKAVVADAIAAARSVTIPIENTILQEIGLDKKRLPKRHEPKAGSVQIHLAEAPPFVQSETASSYNCKNSFVQSENAVRTNGVSLLSSDTDSDYEAGRQACCVENQNGNSATNGKTPARPPENLPPEEPEDDAFVQILNRHGFIYLDPPEMEQVRDALGKADLQIFDGIIQDRLTRGRIGLPILIDLARKARRTQGRINAHRKPAQMERGEDESFEQWIARMHPQPKTQEERDVLFDKWLDAAKHAKAGAR